MPESPAANPADPAPASSDRMAGSAADPPAPQGGLRRDDVAAVEPVAEAAGGNGPDEVAPASIGPDDYADFSVPKGLPIDRQGMAEFKQVAADLGLSQDQAQSLVDLQAGRIQAASAEQSAAWEKQQADWQAAVRADREIGGSEMSARVGVAKRAIARFGSPALRKVLTETGLGNHPELVRFAYRVGRAIADDGVILPSQPGRRRSAAETLYGPSDN